MHADTEFLKLVREYQQSAQEAAGTENEGALMQFVKDDQILTRAIREITQRQERGLFAASDEELAS